MINKLVELAKLKDKIDIKRGEEKYFDYNWLIGQIAEELDEVAVEIKEQNSAYLEDELSDILWGWIILVEKLNSKGYCGTVEDIMHRAKKKYSERVLPLKGNSEDYVIWREVKQKQKVALNSEQKGLIHKNNI